jgi:hypothetical protein
VNIFDLLPQTKAEVLSDAVALGAVSSPLWLHEMSGIAKDLLPWFGIAWLAVQIVVKLHMTYGRKNSPK